jgi:hypothetical protein
MRKTLEHFKTFYQIAKEEGLAEALRYDFQETGLKKYVEGIREKRERKKEFGKALHDCYRSFFGLNPDEINRGEHFRPHYQRRVPE